MDRREWMKYCSAISGGVTFSTLGANNLIYNSESPANPALDVEEIHIINLSHTDFGYTDLPSSAWDYHVNNIRLAMRYIDETKNYPPDSRFKWTMEALWILERFWIEASLEERDRFDKYVNEGLIDVTAMPASLTCLVDSYEWEREMDRLSGLLKKYKVQVAMEDDVNGLPYGLVDSLLKRQVKYMLMGTNLYSGGTPVPAPSFFWWEGASGNKILMYNGETYANGFNYFNAKEWRRGPVPNRYDVWFNPPSGNDIFSSEKEDVKVSYEILRGKLDALKKAGYAHRLLQLSFTNHWTMDNDLPCRQLSEFIKTWNEMGLLPRLVFSTPSAFFNKMVAELPPDLLTLKGEWCDWWADGIAASPFELALLQGAKRRNRDIGSSLAYWGGSNAAIEKKIDELSHDLVFAAEHTWASYDSVAHPYNERTVGNHYQKFEVVLRADENSKRLRADIIRGSNQYKPLSQTNFFEAFNPGMETRSGWVELSARAMRMQVNGAEEIGSGKFFPFEQTLESEWASGKGASEPPKDFPNDVWPYFPGKYRFYIENLHPGERKKFKLVNNTAHVSSVSSGRYFTVVTDNSGSIRNLLYTPLNKNVFDGLAGYLPGQLVVERPQGKYVRDAIANRSLNQASIVHTSPVVSEYSKVDSFYAIRYLVVLEEAFAKRIEQQWNIFANIPRIEITTTIWMKENIDPIAVYIAFPFNMKSPKIFYNSLGNQVQVGVGQIPNTCGEYQNIQNGASFQNEEFSLAISTPDCPLGIFESIQRGKTRKTFSPKNGYFFNMVCQNYWTTNFAILSPTKLVVRHILDFGNSGEIVLPVAGEEIWAYPCV